MFEFKTINWGVILHLEDLKNPRKNWMDNNGWEMVKPMHDIILNNKRGVVHQLLFFLWM
jgi:hypothetical protein